MSEPRTEAGRKMLYDMGLDDPIVGKSRQALAVRRIRAIEVEAVAAERARIAALVEAMYDEWEINVVIEALDVAIDTRNAMQVNRERWERARSALRAALDELDKP